MFYLFCCALNSSRLIGALMVSFFLSLSFCSCSLDSWEAEAVQLLPIGPFFNRARLFSFDLNIAGSGEWLLTISINNKNRRVCKPAKRDPPTFSCSAGYAVHDIDGWSYWIGYTGYTFIMIFPMFVKLDTTTCWPLAIAWRIPVGCSAIVHSMRSSC